MFWHGFRRGLIGFSTGFAVALVVCAAPALAEPLYGSDGVRADVSVFGEQLTAEYTPLIELDSSNGLSLARRDTVSTSGAGSVTNTGGEHVLDTGAGSAGFASLVTKERGRYQPGLVALPGMGVRLGSLPTGDQVARWGYFDVDGSDAVLDGVFMGADADGVFVELVSGGTTVEKVYRANWDALRDLDVTDPFVVRFPHVWYFGGPAIVKVQTTDGDGNPVYETVHRFEGPGDRPLFEQPKLPVSADVDDGGDSAQLQLFVGGRQYGILGRYDPNRRVVPETRDGVSVAGGATEPLICHRKKSGQANEAKSIKVFSGSGVANATGRYQIYLDPTLTDASFGSLGGVSDSETAVESDTSATAMSGGELIFSRTIAAGGGSKVQGAGIDTLGQELPPNTPVCFAFQNLSNSSATVDADFSVEEEW